MVVRQKPNGGRDSAPLFAVAFITILGLLFCLMIGVAFSEDATVPITVVAVATVIVLYTVVSLTNSDPKPEKNSIIAISKITKKETVHHYKPGKIVKVKKKKGKNAPPTVETIRKIKIDAGLEDIDFPDVPEDDKS